jgi:hypothetical protein
MTDFQLQPLMVWPDAEAVVRAWLVANVASTPNIRTETDNTFGTSSPGATMTLPLVLIQRVPGGGTDADGSTETAVVDVTCFAADRAAMWLLYREVHAWMLRLTGKSTVLGGVDQVLVSNGVGEVDYANPNLKRAITSYEVITRPFSSAFPLPA